jgi:PAS domain S-box
MARFPQLKLYPLVMLMVALPVAVQFAIFAHLTKQTDELQKTAHKLTVRRDIVNKINNVFLNTFFGFQSLMQFKMYGKPGTDKYYHQYTAKIKKQTAELADLIEHGTGDRVGAVTLRQQSKRFLTDLARSQFNPDPDAEVTTIFQGLEENVRLRESARDLFMLFGNFGRKAQEEVAAAETPQDGFVSSVVQTTNLSVALNTILAMTFASLFVLGTVRKLNVLKENTARFASGEPLLKRLEASDEFGDLDRTFHDMAEAITALRLKEKAMTELLREGKEGLESLLDSVPAALVVATEDGLVESINPSAERLFSHSAESISGQSLDKLFIKSAKQEGSTLSLLLKAGAEKMLQLEALSLEQEVIPVAASATEFEGPYGKRVLVTIIDETERFKLEQLKREFYSMVSHDIRTPLTTVGVVLELANQGQYGPISEELSDKLTTAERNTQRLLEMVGRLLAVEKLDEGRVELNLENEEITEIVDSAVESVNQLCEEKRIKLETKITPEDATIRCDQTFIIQVLTNLISNAIKYSPEGGTISVIATRGFTSAEFSVQDHGPGIPEGKRTTIFERFKQAEANRDRKAGGFGLGLAICKSIVEQHGGKIGVKSEEGKGSTFWFSLPEA